MAPKTLIYLYEAKLLCPFRLSTGHVKTRVYILNDKKEQSLLGKYDGIRLGIVKLSPIGAKEAVSIDEADCSDEIQRMENQTHDVSPTPRKRRQPQKELSREEKHKPK